MPDQVFVDAQVIKFATESVFLRPKEPETFEWVGKACSVVVHEFVTHKWRDQLSGDIRKEADLLPAVAALARDERILLVKHGELDMEVWGLPGSFGRRTVMWGVTIGDLPSPFEYSRIVSGPSGSAREYRSSFIRSIRDPRFLELARSCGALDGADVSENQLWDAFHLWTAESAGVPYFLTLDYRLTRRTKTAGKQGPRVTIVKPSELLSQFRRTEPHQK